MMKSNYIRLFLLVLSVSLLMTGCKPKDKPDSNHQTATEAPTKEENAAAVKDMLRQGVNKAVRTLTSENGFFNSDSLKIAMPEDVQSLIDNVKKIPQGDKLVDNVLSQINKVAGASAEPIGVIINAAIDSMSVDEANSILLSDSAAATHYLQKIVREPLHTACEPIIIQSLDKKMLGNITPRDAWVTLAENYNKVADSKVGKIAKLQTADSELDEFVTDKILDAVFYLIAKEEINVRKHPAARISKSVAKSFGWIDNKKKK